MSWIQVLSIIITTVIAAFAVWREVKSLEGRLDTRIENQAQRTDRLYEMFIDLLKEGRGK